MTVHVLRRTRRRRSAWKNGGGSTEEVVISPPRSALSDFAWRVSIADVTRSGPFSAFEGVERIIMVVDGAGLILDVDGVDHTLGPMQPLIFSGDVVTSARLIDGPTRDINVMTRRDAVTADVTVVAVTACSKRDVRVAHDEELVVLVASGQVSVREVVTALDDPEMIDARGMRDEPFAATLFAFDAVHQRGASWMELSGDAVVVVVRVRHLASPGTTVAHDEPMSKEDSQVGPIRFPSSSLVTPLGG